MDENLGLAARTASRALFGDSSSEGVHLGYDRLFDISNRANAAALLLHHAVVLHGPAPRAQPVRSKKAIRVFVSYSKAVSIAKGRSHDHAEHLLFEVAENTLRTLSQVHSAWLARPRTEPFSKIERQAFLVLVEATGSAGSLSSLPDRDPGKAVEAVAKRVEVLGGDVAALAESATMSSAGSATGAAFAGASDELLRRAGGGLSLTAVAERLRVSRQRVHKRIQEGTVLGMRGLDGTIVVPAFQVEAGEDGHRIMPGLEHAVRPFVEAGEGGWAALQWMLDQDPNLSATPIEAIRAGRLDDVSRAARAYVGADEG